MQKKKIVWETASKMSDDKKTNYLFMPCKIIPLEFYDGVVVAICLSQKGCELKVRYFIDGEYKCEWFYDFDIALESKQKNKGD